MSGSDFRIVVVCTANICRSPMIERMLRYELRVRLAPDDVARFIVESAGTYGLEGSTMHPHTFDVLADRGIDNDGFVARELTEAILAGADLVLGATREHRAAAVALAPVNIRRTFTLREFARLVESLGETYDGDVTDRARSLVEAAACNRGQVSAQPSDDDLPDPIGGPREVYDETGALSAVAIGVIVDALSVGSGVQGGM